MTWGAIGGAAIGAAGSYASQKSMQPNKFGGGMDYANKAARQPMLDTLKTAKDIYSQPAINPLMQQGFDLAALLPQTMQPYLDYGTAMLTAGGGGMAGQMAGAGQLMGFDPTMYNAQFQAGGAVGPQFDQRTYNQVFGNYQAGIDPMLQSIAQMNARTLNEQMLPGVAGQAIMSGNQAGSKWGDNTAIAQRGALDRNAQAAAQLYAQGAQQGNQMGGQYGLSTADAINRALLQNTALGNQLNFAQASDNAQNKLRALGLATDVYGNVVGQTNPYFDSMVNLQAKLPSLLQQYGMAQRNAPADWLGQYQDAISVVGNFGTGGASSVPSGGMDYGQMILAGIQGADWGRDVMSNWGKSSSGNTSEYGFDPRDYYPEG